MADKKYPLDITVACSIGLEGGLARFWDELPHFKRDDFDLVHEWNRALRKTMQEPEFRQYIGATYRILLNLPATTVSKIIDRLSVPYRSYYYAKRFTDAANFVNKKSDISSNIVDFGRGLSPWGHIVKKNCPGVQIYTFDMPETDAVFQSVSEKLKLQNPHFNKMPDKIVFDKDIFVSLGTFVYLPKDEQRAKLHQASQQFRNLFIELEKSNSVQQDSEIVNDMGATYNPGLSVSEIQEQIGTEIPFQLQNLSGCIKNARLSQSIKNATEMFLVR